MQSDIDTAGKLADANALKRKRSPSLSSPVSVPQKMQKTNLQINYLARQSTNDLALLNKNDTISGLLDILSAYSSVLDRHESLASNLGARPLGPILIKRFERCFDGPPEVIASHSHSKDSADSPQVTWLEVVQFAQSHPGQFTLSTFSEGRRVCQFYYPQKQVRLQVTEEDFLFIKSGRCQDLIPPLPIWEDEEKEVGTCEILEKQLRELTNAADTLAARTRQLTHRLKGRRMAIMERRAGEKVGDSKLDVEHDSVHDVSPDLSAAQPSPAAGANFTVVNGQHAPQTNGATESTTSNTVRNELLKHFQSLSQNQIPAERTRRPSFSGGSPTRTNGSNGFFSTPSHEHDYSVQPHETQSAAQPRPDPLSYHMADPNPTPVAAQNRIPSTATPSSHGKHNFSRPLAPGQEVSQPFRPVCQALMESLPRGARVMPPCDRCRRLKMDCLKNLTSCQGCTKKHARCHWKDVDRSEVEGLEGVTAAAAAAAAAAANMDPKTSLSSDDDEDDDDAALQDLEALGRDDTSASPLSASAPASPMPQPQLQPVPQPQPHADERPVSAPFTIPGFTSVNSLPRALTAAPTPVAAAAPAPAPILPQREERQLSPFSALLSRPPMELDRPRSEPAPKEDPTPAAAPAPAAPAVAVGWRAV